MLIALRNGLIGSQMLNAWLAACAAPGIWVPAMAGLCAHPGVPADGGGKVGAHFGRVDEKAGNSRRHCATCCAKWARTWRWWQANSGRGCAVWDGPGRPRWPTGWAAIALSCWVVSAPGGRTAEGQEGGARGRPRADPGRELYRGPQTPGMGLWGCGWPLRAAG